MRGYANLLEKHLRYIKNEGLTRYNFGLRTSVWQISLEPFKQFKFCFLSKQGYKDGFIGLFLSAFWAWYQTTAQISLFIYQRKRALNNS
jgi:hypothetical protein